MWHDTMLAGCMPVWDFSTTCIIPKAQPVESLKPYCSLKPGVKLKRPYLVHGGRGSSSDFCGWGSKGLGQLNHQQRSRFVFSCKPRPGRSPLSRQGFHLGFKTVSVLAQESRPVVKVSGSSSSIAVSLTTATTITSTTKKDVELSRITKCDMRLLPGGHSTTEIILGEDEKLRRHRISCANKGKVPWNKGGKHTPETIRLIKEKTSQAMQSPTVLAKLRLNARHPQSNETRGKIREKLRERWDMKKKIRGYQEILLKEWRNCVADTARKGGLTEEELAWNSYSVIKRNLRLAANSVARAERTKKIVEEKPKRQGKSQEHRQRISEAIKAKWEDPAYKSKVRQGMSKNNDSVRPKKRSPPKRAATKRPATKRAASSGGVIKGPLDHGFVTAVMSGEKKRHQAELASKEQRDDNQSAETAGKTQSRPRHRKVDLLKRYVMPATSVDEDIPEEEETSAEELSFLAAHSFVDPLASEKLSRLKMIQASRSDMDQRRREAIEHAKMLMAEAARAANILEEAAGKSESALESLAEIHGLIEEAAHFIQAADSVDGTKTDSGALWRRTMASYQSSDAELQMESQGQHESTCRPDDSIASSSDSEASHEHDRDRQSGQDITVGKTTSSKMPDCAGVLMFGSEMRESAVWDVHNPFTKESTAERSFPSFVGLLNGRARSFAAMKETESKTLFETWQHAGLVTVENKNAGCL